jgi:hypothetical protein
LVGTQAGKESHQILWENGKDINCNELLHHNSIKTMNTMGVIVKQEEREIGRYDGDQP